MRDLHGIIAVVAGATRGAGRGIAVELGAAGAAVYCTGRSTRGSPSDMNRPETIEETAEMVQAAGGTGIPVRVDHASEEEVGALFGRIRAEQGGRLNLLVNDIWGGDPLAEWGRPFWTLTPERGLRMLQSAVFTHILTSRYGVPLMVERGDGLVIEVTDGDTLDYRGNLFYDLAKVSVLRLAYAMAEELKGTGVTALALTPGYLRSEAVLDHWGVTEANWQEGVAKDRYFAGSETPHFIGRAVVALARDPNVREKAGKALATWHLAREYGFTDTDGRQPHWGEFYRQARAQARAAKAP